MLHESLSSSVIRIDHTPTTSISSKMTAAAQYDMYILEQYDVVWDELLVPISLRNKSYLCSILIRMKLGRLGFGVVLALGKMQNRTTSVAKTSPV